MDEVDRKRIARRIGLAVLVFAGLLALGTVLFLAVGEESAEEAFYRAFGAFTTASLVGEPDTSKERAIAAALTVAGGLFYLLLVGSVVQAVVRRDVVTDSMRDRRRKVRMRRLREHIIVCGYGNVGRAVGRLRGRAGGATAPVAMTANSAPAGRT